MNKSIVDLIDEKIKDYNWNNDDEPVKIIMDTYSYALLIEELGISVDTSFDEFRGLKIKVDPDIDELCQIL